MCHAHLVGGAGTTGGVRATEHTLPKPVHHPSKELYRRSSIGVIGNFLFPDQSKGCLGVRAWLQLFWCRSSGRSRQTSVILGQRPEGAVLGVERAVVPSPCVPPGAMQ